MCNFSHRGRWKRMIDFSGPYGRSGELHRISVEIPLAPDSGHVDVQAAHTDFVTSAQALGLLAGGDIRVRGLNVHMRSEEHRSELQSLMRISYAVFCLKKKRTLRISIAEDDSRNQQDCINNSMNINHD